MVGYIHSTESFGTVDGPGIRFVVFMSGCPMRCLYCHNPDTWEMNKDNPMSVEEILRKYDSVKAFLKGGGITVTGGEPLYQIDFITQLFKECKKKGIHTCLDTSGILYEDNEKYFELIKYTDLVMLDIKHINPYEHKKLTAHSNERIIAFARFLDKNNVPVWIRHVAVPGITLDEKYLYELGEFIGSLSNVKALDVLPYHDMGRVKYERLGIAYPLAHTPPASKEDAVWARNIILEGIRSIRSKNK